ncbi:MAG: cupin domain-containing protein [Chitinophagaceae bacterium]|nr:cupin domain-containing protein [Chitinophagaceae bacterium]
MPKTIMYNPDTTAYQELFNEEKDSVVFNSGFVTLLPDQAGDIHSTKSNEEMIVTLSGTGKIKISNGNNLDIQYGNVAHIPANTEHQVLNTGTIDLKYIYITTKSK